jgi:[NiFe] hydrogenase diaphorase moiety small subunit
MTEPTTENRDSVSLTIDGQPVTAKAGTNLVKVALENGVFIPSLCYYEHIEPPLGTCRVCTCRIDGQTGPACMERVREGMQVEINTPELDDLRHAVVEMMFAEGNHFCPGCPKSGNCDLQHMGYEMGLRHIRFPHLFEDRLTDFEPRRMVIEHNRCVKCMRCVVEVLTDDGKQVFSYCNRANETVVGIDYDQEARLSNEQAEAAMRLCPTGAIIVRGQSSWAKPFGDRLYDLKSSRPAPQEPLPAVPEQHLKVAGREKKSVATISLAGCFGCHMSMLDNDLKFIEAMEIIEFNKSPLNDIKEFTTRCDLGLIEGGCCNSDNVEVLREFRRKCDVLVCVGECAIFGGVPAMRNTIPLRECLEETYLECESVTPGQGVVPYSEDLPKLLDRVYACDEIVEIDHYIPGCPPSAEFIWKSVANILWGTEYSILYSDIKYD